MARNGLCTAASKGYHRAHTQHTHTQMHRNTHDAAINNANLLATSSKSRPQVAAPLEGSISFRRREKSPPLALTRRCYQTPVKDDAACTQERIHGVLNRNRTDGHSLNSSSTFKSRTRTARSPLRQSAPRRDTERETRDGTIPPHLLPEQAHFRGSPPFFFPFLRGARSLQRRPKHRKSNPVNSNPSRPLPSTQRSITLHHKQLRKPSLRNGTRGNRRQSVPNHGRGFRPIAQSARSPGTGRGRCPRR